jgi:hypothetical protein
MATVNPNAWGACPFCGAAVRPGAAACSMCGDRSPIPASQLANVPRHVRRRLILTQGFRALIVIAACIALAYALITTVLAGPPVVADPLTTAGTYTLGPGNSTYLAGAITGGDYIVGNWTTVAPAGTLITMSVYNSTEFPLYLSNDAATPDYSINATASGRIIFSPLYTDTFTFVFTNPYPESSHLNVTVYITTEYESNVGDDGFG